MSAAIKQLKNNNPNYKNSILTAKEEVRDKAKKGLLSGNTSDRVDLKNGVNKEFAIIKFGEASEKEQKKAIEDFFKNLAEQVTNVFKNNSNIISGTSQTENPQTPATNADGTSQTEKPQIPDINTDSLVPTGDYSQIEKPQLSPAIRIMSEQIKNAGNYNKPTNPTQNVPPLFDAGAKIKQLETQLASMQEAYEKLQAKGIEPKELKEQIDKVQAELDKLRAKNN